MSRIELTEWELRERFDEFIDETHEELGKELKVYGYTLSPSRALRSADPIAYECELRNYADSIRDEYLVAGWND